MRPLYEEFDLDDFNFADSMAVSRIRRSLAREEKRAAGRHRTGPRTERDIDDYRDYRDYGRHGEDEPDAWPGIDREH